jgi:hypothetical protein
MYLHGAGNVVKGASLSGYKAVGIPGTVMGLDTALRKYGKLPRAKVMETCNTARTRVTAWCKRALRRDLRISQKAVQTPFTKAAYQRQSKLPLGWRWSPDSRGFRRLCSDGGRASQLYVPGRHDPLRATSLIWRRNDVRNPQCARRLRYAGA